MFRRITASLSLISLVLVTLAPLATFAAPAKQNGNRQQGRRFKKLAPEFEVASTRTTVRPSNALIVRLKPDCKIIQGMAQRL